MKKFILFVLIMAGFMVWLKNWITSGQMDQFITQHKNPDVTPNLLYTLAETYYVLQESKSAAYYYRWLIQDYPDFKAIAKARWNLGQSYEDLKQRPLALEQYVILKDSYSVTEYGQLANARYGQIKF